MTDGNAMDSLIAAAWSARENAWAWRSGTKVGCCLLTKSGKTYIGWNTEGPWGTSTHAERAAVASMADHADRITAVAVVAERAVLRGVEHARRDRAVATGRGRIPARSPH